MENESTEATKPSQIVLDVLRALFVAVELLVAVFLVVSVVTGLVVMSNATSPAEDTVVPAVNIEDVAILALAAAVAVVGSIYSVRFWLKRSWHVVTVAVATALGVLIFSWLLLLLNYP